MRPLVLFGFLLSGLGFAACGASSDGGSDGGADPPDLSSPTGDAAAVPLPDGASPPDGGGDENAQLPPMGRAALDPWLASGAYQAWHCEPAPHAARPPGAHGANRVCTNDALYATPSGTEPPVGAASVKELFSSAASTQVIGYAVGRKVAAGDCSTWYFFERSGSSVYADSVGPGVCTGCHTTAPSPSGLTPDHCVYTRAP